jgi:hypothetical protein
LALGLLGLAAFLNGDKTAVFYRVRGEYRDARVLREWHLGANRCRLVELRNDRGEAVTTAYVRIPVPTPPQPRILLTYAGETTGETMLELIPPRPDLVLVAVQYPYRRPHGPLEDLRWPYDVRRTVFRTVAGGMLAVSYLARDEHLPLARLTVLGASLGTSFGVIHGALDPRVTDVMVVHGGGALPAVLWSIDRREGRTWRAPLLAGLGALVVESFDPDRFVGRIAPRPLLVVAARHDRFFPPSSVIALYDHAHPPKRLLWTEGEHVGAGKTALVTEIVRVIEQQLGLGPEPAAAPARNK